MLLLLLCWLVALQGMQAVCLSPPVTAAPAPISDAVAWQQLSLTSSWLLSLYLPFGLFST